MMMEDYSSIITRYSDVITDNIKNPRDVVRFINLFTQKYEKVIQNVDFHDFLMLTLIRYNFYSEYRDLYDGDFIEEKRVTVSVQFEKKEWEPYEQKQIPILYLKNDIEDILKEKLEGRKDREKDNLKKLLEELFDKEPKNTYYEHSYERCIKFQMNFEVYFQVFVADEKEITTDDLFDIEKVNGKKIYRYKVRLEDKELENDKIEKGLERETSLEEYVKRTNVLSLKNDQDLKLYLQKLLWVNKRKVEQTDKIRALILKDFPTAENIWSKIREGDKEKGAEKPLKIGEVGYKKIILDEFQKIPPLNVFADLVDEKDKIIFTQNDKIDQMIDAEIKKNMEDVKGGEFTMNGRKKKVQLDNFKISRFQVTQELYREVMRETPSYFNGHNLPVECVSWYDAVEFCNKLSSMCGRNHYYQINKETKDKNIKNEYDELKWTVDIVKDANGFRLPTEYQWEYAARHWSRKDKKECAVYAGYTGTDENIEELKKYAWFWENSEERTHEVGSADGKDELAIHDMSGNVLEWCEDLYEETAYRVLRGGSWYLRAERCAVSYRRYALPGYRTYDIGFRLVLPQ